MRRVLLTSVTALAFGLVTSAIPASAEVVPPGSPQYGKIYALASSPANCMDSAGGEAYPGDAVLSYWCHNADNQQWTYNIYTHQIVSGLQGREAFCVDIGGDQGSNGSPIIDNVCSPSASQVWRIEDQSLYNPQSGKCLDDPSGQIHQLQIWDCNIGGNANQNWDIVGYTG
jgi:hypothetical protein